MRRHPVSACYVRVPRAPWIRPLAIAAAIGLGFAAFLSGDASAQQPAAQEEASPSDAPPALAPQPAPGLYAPPIQAPVKLAPAAVHTVCPTFRIRPQDEVWLVSTRHLGCPGPFVPTYQMWRYEHGWWLPRTGGEFFAADSPDVVSLFYIHGNRVESGEAFSEGLEVYFQLVGKFDGERPVRFVIWSWPSSQIHGPLRDVRSKAVLSDNDAWYLGYFLAHLNPHTPVGLVGFSYGARIISGALHTLGGGSMFGQVLPPAPRPPIRVALWIAAVHNHWLIPGQANGNALPLADAWLSTVNCCDPVMARYRWVEKGSNPAALGYAGLAGRNWIPYEWQARFHELDVSHIVGRRHEMRPYLYSPAIQQQTRQYALWYEVYAAPNAPSAVPLATASR